MALLIVSEADMTAVTRIPTPDRRMTACIGEWTRPLRIARLLIAALLLFLALSSDAFARTDGEAAFQPGPFAICDAAGSNCRAVSLWEVNPSSSDLQLRQEIVARPAPSALARAPTLWIVATASSEVRWNGVLIGSNGRPAPVAQNEIPGSYISSFTVPAKLVRFGRNLLTVRMSFHHLWLPVRTPVRAIWLDPSSVSDIPDLRTYLPAVPIFGVLAVALAYFGFVVLFDRTNRAARILAVIAALATAQLSLETVRMFITYPYPWQLVRVGGIALLSAVISTLIATYVAQRLWPARSRPVVTVTAVATAALLILIPSFDARALAAIGVGLTAAMACALAGMRRQPRVAITIFMAASTALTLLLVQQSEFLNASWYFVLATLLIALMVEQLLDFAQARRQAELLSQRLQRLGRQREPVLLKEGSRVHRIDPGDIFRISAADDYCEAHLTDGRRLLVSATLSRLAAMLPESFVRIHRSHVVNRAHVVSIAGAASGRSLHLASGETLPIGRSFAAVTASSLAFDS